LARIGQGVSQAAVSLRTTRLVPKKLSEALQQVRPSGVKREEFPVAGTGEGGLALRLMQTGGFQQRQQLRAVLFSGCRPPGAHPRQNALALTPDAGNGGIDTFFLQDTRHLLEDGGGIGAGFRLGEAGGQ
jgi:hypothetical protein